MLVAVLEASALALALAADAFAVALTQGARFRPGWLQALAIAAVFGTLQGLMPLLGWGLGVLALEQVARFDHWIAFALLALLGVQMIWADHARRPVRPLAGSALLAAGLATSIDAFAAGITLPAFDLQPLAACGLIGGITAALCLVAARIGRRAGERFGRGAEIVGGLLLIGLGVKILVEHLAA